MCAYRKASGSRRCDTSGAVSARRYPASTTSSTSSMRPSSPRLLTSAHVDSIRAIASESGSSMTLRACSMAAADRPRATSIDARNASAVAATVASPAGTSASSSASARAVWPRITAKFRARNSAICTRSGPDVSAAS
ncbi:Uncharacterised protein [Mycobacteroides abscessus subsp. abscessus]|nr:Uncharacterised protein [Mycobacteroides abscessus subsp. abscessus]